MVRERSKLFGDPFQFEKVGSTINLVLITNKFLIKTHSSQPTSPMLHVGVHATFADFHHDASAATPSHKKQPT